LRGAPSNARAQCPSQCSQLALDLEHCGGVRVKKRTKTVFNWGFTVSAGSFQSEDNKKKQDARVWLRFVSVPVVSFDFF